MLPGNVADRRDGAAKRTGWLGANGARRSSLGRAAVPAICGRRRRRQTSRKRWNPEEHGRNALLLATCLLGNDRNMRIPGSKRGASIRVVRLDSVP